MPSRIRSLLHSTMPPSVHATVLPTFAMARDDRFSLSFLVLGTSLFLLASGATLLWVG